jgi:hypothetical protein
LSPHAAHGLCTQPLSSYTGCTSQRLGSDSGLNPGSQAVRRGAFLEVRRLGWSAGLFYGGEETRPGRAGVLRHRLDLLKLASRRMGSVCEAGVLRHRLDLMTLALWAPGLCVRLESSHSG